MPKNLRILTKPNDGDKHVKIRLEQTFDFLEVLSLKLTQADVYRKFAADYGVLVGRVIANGGFGVPNAKVAVFVPIDKNDNSLVQSLYPYETTKDINHEGVRYNLLEDDKQFSCHKPIGTFPNKRKVLDNDVWLEIYDKYYKFTTTTNFAGDYMIFGIPTGSQNIHMDVDVSNIDHISVKPYDLIDQGYNENLFESRTTFKSGTDLGSLVQVQSRDYAVNILPFWGDLEENEVGVNRVDFNLGIEIIPTATFFGTIFTDSKKSSVRKKCQPRKTLGKNCDLSTGKGRVEIIRRVSRESNEVELFELESKQIDGDGNWAFTVPMNLDRVVTDDFGNLVPSEDPNVGIPTRSQVRFRMSLEEHGGGLKYRTASYLVPNMYNRFEFGNDTEDFDFFEMRWKKAYTVTNYIPRYQKVSGHNTDQFTGIKDIGECENTAPFPFNRVAVYPSVLFNILCLIITVFGVIINIINRIIEIIIFNVVLTFVCFLKHPTRPKKRGACRCQACYNLDNGLNNTTGEVPGGWLNPVDPDYCYTPGPNTSICLDCAICYNGEGDDVTTQTFAFKESTILLPSYVDATSYNNGNNLAPAVAGIYTLDGAEFYIETDGFGNLTTVNIVNQDPLVISPTYAVNIPAGTFGGADSGYSFTLTVRDILILSQYALATDGTYSNKTEATGDFTYGLGLGSGVEFDIIISSGKISSIQIQPGESGVGYSYYNYLSPTAELFVLDAGVFGATKTISFHPSAFVTSQTIDGIVVDCENWDIDDCNNKCTTCPVTLIDLECNGVPYTDGVQWAQCINENLAESLGVIKYHFYNDWVIGSLYSILFDYKVRFKRKGKSFEKFCDYDCRAIGITSPTANQPNYEHRKNRCHDAFIVEEQIFNGAVPNITCTYGTSERVQIEDTQGNPNGRGLIVEYDDYFYYSARHDIEINVATSGDTLTVAQKDFLLFATNIIELGSMVSCDIDNEPFLVDNLEATTYQKDDGTGTLFDFNDCFNACPINRGGIQLMSQAGIEIAFAEASNNPSLTGDDGEIYQLVGTEDFVPDYDQNNAVIIFDRDDIILRRKLCENFQYYGVTGVYTSTERPTGGDAYVQEVIPAPDVALETLEFTTDVCAGFDDVGTVPADKMHPYYMYFGIRQGQTALDKLRKNYFDRCKD